jgi:PAS domain S-box-containing protein
LAIAATTPLILPASPAAPPGRILAVIFDLSPDAIAINRARDGVFVAVNQGFTSLTGWSASEAQGRRLTEVDIWADPAERDELVEALRRDRSVRNHEMHFRRKGGEVRTGLLSANPVRLGQEELILSVLRDVTELASARRDRAALEAQLRQAQKMDALGRLAGGVAHDFNNLLTVMAAATSSARLDAEDPARVREALAEIDEACRRAVALTSQLLAFGRRGPLAARPFDLRRPLEEMRRLLGRVIGEDVTIEVAVAPGTGSVLGDPNQIEQVILNLALNARDAMEQGGRLTISADRAREEELPPEARRSGRPFLRLTVSDTGTGIPPEVRARLFEPFFTTKPDGKGTGLGLATVKAIVGQHQGHVAVRSEPGRGSSFDVFLPAAPAAADAAAPGIARPVPTGNGETILLVEDDPLVLDVARRMLDRLGYRVLTAPDGAEGLELVRSPSTRIDLLVTDVVMPGMSGPELASRAQRLRPRLPVVFVSGYPQPAGSGGAVEVLAKPFGAEALAARVRAALAPAAACGA